VNTNEIRLKAPDPNKKYHLEKILNVDDSRFKDKENLQQFIRLLSPNNEVRMYSVPVDIKKAADEDWFEEGIAIIDEGQILALVKIDEFFDCGMF
jgi:hypothetical protein